MSRHHGGSFVVPLALALAPLLGACRTTGEPEPALEPRQLRVLSWNVHHCEGLDRRLDIERVAAVIRATSPDIVALQEVDVRTTRSNGVDQAAELARLTGLDVVFGKSIDYAGGEYGNAILSRWPVEDHRVYPLPLFGEGEQRTALVAHIAAPANAGGALRLVATHLDHRTEHEERVASVRTIEGLVVGLGPMPTLLVGDLNARRDSPPLELLSRSWRLTNDGELPTIPAEDPDRQIDWVLVRPPDAWHVVEARVVDEPVASDHRPILVVLARVRSAATAP